MRVQHEKDRSLFSPHLNPNFSPQKDQSYILCHTKKFNKALAYFKVSRAQNKKIIMDTQRDINKVLCFISSAASSLFLP